MFFYENNDVSTRSETVLENDNLYRSLYFIITYLPLNLTVIVNVFFFN